MPSLDLQYVTELVHHAKDGDANAFAELFAATYPQQYQFCCSFLKDDYLARQALQETYIQALNTLSRLNDNALFINWLTRINFRECLKIKQKRDPSMARDMENTPVVVSGRRSTIRQLMNLPFTEGQVLLLKGYCGMRTRQIAALTEMTPRQVREYMSTGIRRLPRQGMEGGGEA